MDSLANAILVFAPTAKVVGHRDFKNVKKSCPNYDVSKDFKRK